MPNLLRILQLGCLSLQESVGGTEKIKSPFGWLEEVKSTKWPSCRKERKKLHPDTHTVKKQHSLNRI